MVDSIGSVFAGRKEQIEVATACVLAGGHLLAEDIPGVGKTLLAQTLAATLGGTFARVQGTADLLPADVVGSLAPNADGFGLHFRPGPVFANVVLFDELNRANPRTQSALLEVMEEGCVTVDGTTHAVPAPFVVIATSRTAVSRLRRATSSGIPRRTSGSPPVSRTLSMPSRQATRTTRTMSSNDSVSLARVKSPEPCGRQ